MTEENPFWRFSLQIYAREGIAEECIDLQDRHGINVNVLLFCAWLGAMSGVALGGTELDACENAVSEWDRSIVRPLRAVRRSLKVLTSADSLRERVKALELEAERAEQAVLFELAERWLASAALDAAPSAISNVEALCARYSLRARSAAPRLIEILEAQDW